jgi:hypothetical protein
MRKLSLLTAIVLLSAAWVAAQTTSQGGGSQTAPQGGSYGSSQTSSNAPGTSIEGCLSGSGGNYTLTDSSGKTYQLQGDTSKLSAEVGHQVRIRGSASGAAAGATSPYGGTASSSTSGAGGTPPSSTTAPSGAAAGPSGSATSAILFDVKNVRKVSDTCTPSSMSK